MGIVSNAQFFTPMLFEAHLGMPADKLGFEPSLIFYSYGHGVAKPGGQLYEMAREELRKLGIAAGNALYVGNDMLNDMKPAREVGFRTCLFAGDGRSLRLRDEAVAGGYADRAVKDLSRMLTVVGA